MPKYMEFLRGRLTETISGTYCETEIRTPASKTEKMAMLIHKVVFDGDDLVCANDEWMQIRAALQKRSKTGIPGGISNSDVVCQWKRFFRNIAQTSSQTEGGPWEIDFDPPVLYAKDGIWLAMLKTYLTTAGGTKTVDVMIGYTLEKVAAQDFIDALVE
ncbi:hypothetical protein ES703_116367 [subsurface metagenome]